MKPDVEKKENYLKKMFRLYHYIFSPDDPEKARDVADYLSTVKSNMNSKLTYYAFFPIIIAGLLSLLLIISRIFAFDLPKRELIENLRNISVLIAGMPFILYYPFPFRLYKKYQEVRCPKCGGYIPFYKWQCPGCEKVHENRHIFLNCNGCVMKVGKLHKNLQSIKCLNDKCGYDLYFYEPYEGGFNDHSFRGE